MIEVGSLILGLIFAIFGARFLVDGASAIARRFDLPDVIIGAIIIGFGTSMPEFTVNIFSAVHHHTDLAITNVLGSNIFNMLLILGICSIICPLTIQESLRKKDLPFHLIGGIVIGVCGNEIVLDGLDFNKLIPSDGIVFLLFFCIYLYFTFYATERKSKKPESGTEKADREHGVVKPLVFIVLGLAGLMGGGEMIVDSASRLAIRFGLAQHLVGLLIVGPGTSLPELLTSVVAVIRKKPGMAVGNVVGSNIFNIFFTLGVSSVIYPLPLNMSLNLAILVTVAGSLLLLVFASTGRQGNLGRIKGIFLFLSYIGYTTYLIGTA